MAKLNPERLEGYHHMFDRLLLYTLGAQLISPDQVDKIIRNADKIIKKTIDIDSQKRTTWMYTTKEGRKARYDGEFDGEDLRLHYLHTWNVVKEVVKANLTKPDKRSEDDSESP